MTRNAATWLGVLGVFALVSEGGTAALRGPVKLSLEVIVNRIDGGPAPACRASATIEPHGKTEWWLAFGAARPHPKRAWEAPSNEVRCGAGPLDEAQVHPGGLPGEPYLVVGISTHTRSVPEGPLVLEVSVSSRKLTGFGADGHAVYEQTRERRTVSILDEGDAFLPLLITNAAEREAFRLQELLLRVEARGARGQAAAYGAISVSSGVKGAELLLDGGLVGTISDGGETLRNVLVGERVIGVRDPSGRVIQRLVHVEENRTVLVVLDPPDPVRPAASYRLLSLGKNPQGSEEYQRERDGAVVVKVPAGVFLMGNRKTERNPLEHRVYVSDFLIDKTGVTWGRHKRFAEATGTTLPPDEPWWGIHDDHPAVFVTWEEAKGYCEWVGGRLPTEAEREKACRGTDERMYPWGNEEPDAERAVHRRSWGFAATDPVGAHPKGASPYGVLDMGGNVWEWCADWYDDNYYQASPPRDPRGPTSGQARVVRGGSWDSRPTVLSCSCRSWGHTGYREGDFGFRCAMDPAE